MPCYHPWAPTAALGLRPGLLLPCGQCIGCRLQRSADWATRCIHEAKSHRYNCWLTLTYNDENLPSRYDTGLIHPVTRRKIYSGTLHKLHVQKFLRQLRKTLCRERWLSNRLAWEFDTETPEHSEHIGPSARLLHLRPSLRYYYAGEYGEKYNRPHYHLCLFGIDFTDKKLDKQTPQNFNLYTSKTIEHLWPHGQHRLGELTWETAAYTARYVMKKITGEKQKKHYEKICAETGEIITLAPEFNDMSRAIGIGRRYFEKHHADLYKRETAQAIINGRPTKIPRYYDKLHNAKHPDHMATLKRIRRKEANKKRKDQTPARLKAAETVLTRRIQSLRKTLEET